MTDGPMDQLASNQPTNGPTNQWVDIPFYRDAIATSKNQVMIITLLWGFSVLWYHFTLLLVCLHVTINLFLPDKSSNQIGKYHFMSFGDHFFFTLSVVGEGGVWTVLGRDCPRRLCSKMWASLLVSWHILGRQSVLTILSLSFHPYWPIDRDSYI